MNEAAHLLTLSGVSKSYDMPGHEGQISILHDINLDVSRGNRAAVMGPSGCGKSTLLNLIGTLDRPSQGHVFMEGRDLAGLNDEELASLRNNALGFIFQHHHLLPQCTALENVLLPLLVRSRRVGDDDMQKAEALLDRVGLGGRFHHRPGQLSGGECQRVAVVRALINDPILLLADEPTGSLDGDAAKSLADLLIELNEKDGLTLIVATHATALAERMHRIYTLRDGTLHDFALDD
jgi:lipoprotein-releasing system ATP-binding protein